MKELSIEQKVQRYDEALKRAKKLYEQGTITESLSYVFPELRESGDEKIRKRLIDFFEDWRKTKSHLWGISVNNILTWLEKQGKETSWKPSKEEMDVLYGLAYITNQYDEHKEEVITRLYQDLKREFFNCSSYENMFPTNTCTEDDVRRRSTIQVLEYARSLNVYNQYGKADIDKNIAWLEKQEYVGEIVSRCKTSWYNEGKIQGQIEGLSDEEKYQQGWHDVLEKQGEPTGINPSEFDLRLNKLLKQFETLPKEELASSLSFYLNVVQNNGTYKHEEKQGEQKPAEWSEEDEYMLDETIQHLKQLIRIDKAKHCACDVQYYQRDIDWLKSLRPQNRWKPSDVQLASLTIACDRNDRIGFDLTQLLEELKKL